MHIPLGMSCYLTDLFSFDKAVICQSKIIYIYPNISPDEAEIVLLLNWPTFDLTKQNYLYLSKYFTRWGIFDYAISIYFYPNISKYF